MPGEVDKGITIYFRGDTVSFDRSVTNIDKAIQLLKNETARLNRELKFDPSNARLLQQRFEALTKTEELTLERLQQYRKEMYDAMDVKALTEHNKQFAKVYENIKASETKLADLNKQMASLVRPDGSIVDPKQWQKVHAEQVKTVYELNSLDQLAASIAKSTKDITDEQVFNGAVKNVNKLSKAYEDAANHTAVMTKNLAQITNANTYQGLDKLQKKFEGISKTADTIAKVTAPLSAASAAGLTYSAKSAAEWEHAFVGVQKTVDEIIDDNGELVYSYDDLSKALRQMAMEIPVSAVELAQIAEMAGQLGIKADQIEKFTRTIADLGVTTNVSGSEAATQLARIFNLTSKGDMQNIDRFAAALVELGNNSQTTEKDILDLTERLAAAGTFAGLSQQEILGLATAMSSVGLSAQAGGSAIATIMQNITKEVETNGKHLDEWAEVAGWSVKKFKKSWETDAAGTLIKVLQGLSSSRAEGEAVIKMLDELGIKNIRQIDAMQRLVADEGSLAEYIAMAEKAWEANGALEEEASKRYGELQSKIQILKNTLWEMAVVIGDEMVPYIKDFVDWLTQLVKQFTELDPKAKDMIVKFGLIAAAISPVSKAIAGLTGEKGIVSLIKKMKDFVGQQNFGGGLASLFGQGLSINQGNLGKIKDVILNLEKFLFPEKTAKMGFWESIGTAMENLWGKIVKLAVGLKDLFLIFVSNPVYILVAALAALGVALAAAFLGNEDVRKSLVDTWNLLKEKLRPVVESLMAWLNDAWSFLKSTFEPILEELIAVGSEIWRNLEDIILSIADLIAWLFGENGLGPILAVLWDMLKQVAGWLINTLIGEVFLGIVNGISGIIGWVKDAINWFKELIGIKNKASAAMASGIAGGAISGGVSSLTPQRVIASGGLGMNTASLGRLQLASGGNNTLSLTTNINVNNNGTPIDESVVRRWGNVITDIVSDNLGKRW